MIISLDEIKIKRRIRVDIGNIDPLKSSLNKYGLFHPLLLNSKYELISGYRRLESAKQLGWDKIEVKIIDSLSREELLERELEENLVRKDFTDTELRDGYKRLNKLKKPTKVIRLLSSIRSFFVYIFSKKKADS